MPRERKLLSGGILDRPREFVPTVASAMPDWTRKAACAALGEGGDWALVDQVLGFGEPSGTHTTGSRTREMRRLCAVRCSVRQECLAYGLDAERDLTKLFREGAGHWTSSVDLWGSFGGVTAQERRATQGLPRDERIAVLDAIAREKAREVLLDGETVA